MELFTTMRTPQPSVEPVLKWIAKSMTPKEIHQSRGKGQGFEQSSNDGGLDLTARCISLYINIVERVWMMAGLSSITWPSLIGPWGWVRLLTCCTLSNQCAQIEASSHTLRKRSPSWQRSIIGTFITCKLYNSLHRNRYHHHASFCLEEPNLVTYRWGSHLAGMQHGPC